MLISVIVPVYNAETTIQRCVNSLLSQECGDVEIILINDGSTDRSSEICRAFTQTHPEIRLIEKTNGGVSTARNAGLEVAQGTYVCFVDSDDYVSPTFFSEIRVAILEKPWDLIRFSYCVEKMEATNKRIMKSYSARSREQVLPQIIHDICSKGINSPWAKVYRKDIIDQNGIRFPVGASMAEDRAFNICYSLHINSYLVSERIIYYVNIQNDNSLSRKQHTDLATQFQITSSYLTEAIENAVISETDKEAYRKAINFGICRSVYRDAKELHRNEVGWLVRQKEIWKRCKEINRKRMQYPHTKYCRRISLPVRLCMTVVIDIIAWKLTN